MTTTTPDIDETDAQAIGELSDSVRSRFGRKGHGDRLRCLYAGAFGLRVPDDLRISHWQASDMLEEGAEAFHAWTHRQHFRQIVLGRLAEIHASEGDAAGRRFLRSIGSSGS